MGRLCGVHGLLGVQTVFDGVFHGLGPQMSEEWVGCVVFMDCWVFRQCLMVCFMVLVPR